MHDVTSLLQTATCSSQMLRRMDEQISWAWMKIQPSKSCSLSIRKGVRNENGTFVIRGEFIPLLSEQPVKCLGRQYTTELSDKQVARAVTKQLKDQQEPASRKV